MLRAGTLPKEELNRRDVFGLAPIHYSLHEVFNDPIYSKFQEMLSKALVTNLQFLEKTPFPEPKLREYPSLLYLIKAGADINLPTGNEGISPLQLLGPSPSFSFSFLFFSFYILFSFPFPTPRFPALLITSRHVRHHVTSRHITFFPLTSPHFTSPRMSRLTASPHLVLLL